MTDFISTDIREAFLQANKKFLDDLLQEQWGALYTRTLSEDRQALTRFVASECMQIAAQCFFHPDRLLPHRQGRKTVMDLYRFCADRFIYRIQEGCLVDELSGLVSAFEIAFPFVFPQESTFDTVVLDDSTCLNRHSKACSRDHHSFLRSCDHALISKYLQFLERRYTSDQSRLWRPPIHLRHGIPLLVCDTCPRTPTQSDEIYGSGHPHLDSVSALAICQNYIESRLGVMR